MIVTLTLNPSLDYIQFLSELSAGRLNRCHRELIRPGGKGVNVSLMLAALGTDNRATGFAAGFTGDALVDMLRSHGVECDFINVSGMTRINVKVMAEEETEINGCGPRVDEAELIRLLDSLKCLTASDYLVLSGSVPNGLSSNVYADIMSAVYKSGVKIIVDTSGNALSESLKFRPFLIKPNHHELSELLDTEIETPEDAARAAREACRMGAHNVLCSMGGDGAVLAADNGDTLFCRPPKGKLVNSVAAGDSMLAGFLTEYSRTQDIKSAFRLAVAAGSATAYSEWLADRELVDAMLQKLPKTEIME